MALLKCESCGKEYSDTINKCPHCGYERKLIVCAECETLNLKTNSVCKKCGADFGQLKCAYATKDVETEYYNVLVSKLDSDEKIIEELSDLLLELCVFSDFEGNEEHITKCKDMISELKKVEEAKKVYDECKEDITNAQTASDWEQICKTLDSIKDYEDVQSIYDDCMSKYKECFYKETVEKEAGCKTAKDWDALKEKFEFLGDYLDSADRAKLCNTNSQEIQQKTKKKIIKISSSVAAAVVLILLVFKVIIPGVFYISANNNFKKAEYAKAVSLYEKAGGFIDAEEKKVLSQKADFYQKADKLLSSKNYAEAAKYYAQAGDYSDAQQKLFSTAKVLIEKGDYAKASETFALYEGGDEYKTYADGMSALYGNDFKKAIECFEKVENIEDSAERLKEANYKEGKRWFDDKSYSSAQGYFKIAGDYLDAKDMVIACDLMKAEELYDEGSLNSAKKAFSKLPKNFSYDGISVSKRLNTIEKYSTYVNMCGKWKTSSKSTAKVTQTYKSTGSWDNWTTDYSNSYQYITVRCIINDNGSVTLKGSANYTYHTDYSSLSAYLKPYSTTTTINNTVKSVPNGLKISTYTTITYSGGSWNLRYYKYSPNESISFSYTYESNYTYGKRVEKY